MKIYRKERMFDSDPSLEGVKLESGAVLIYAKDQDKTVMELWKRSVLLNEVE